MNSIHLSLSLLLLTGPALLAEDPAVVPAPPSAPPALEQPTPVDPLTEVLPVLQAKYIDFKSLNYKEGDHLSDLVSRSNGRISLIAPETGISAAPAPIITAALPDGIIYWRLASFTPKKDWADLVAQTKTTMDLQHALGAVLDLRGNLAPDDYAGAALVAALFEPRDPTLLKYFPQRKDAEQHPPQTIPDLMFQGPLIVLTNNQTSGAAEALAACLKADGAVVIGRPTAGKAAVFENLTLANGQVLRYAVSDVSLADGAQLWGHAVNPDIDLTVSAHAEKSALILIGHQEITDVIGESPERHLMSEAALIQGVDPEWDAYLASLEKKPVLLSLPIIHDEALIRALDSLRAIRVSQKGTGPAPQDKTVSPTTTTSIQ